jgi:Nif-specific regulatory protein
MHQKAVDEKRRLTDLLEIAQSLGSKLTLKTSLVHTLEILQRHHAVRSGIVALAEDSKELVVAGAVGITAQAASRLRYRSGQGITGRVFETGRAVIVPQVSHEPLYLDLMRSVEKSKREHSFICLPIKIDEETVGTLGVQLPYLKDRGYERDAKFFGLVAAMIGHAVRVQKLVEAERRQLQDENTQLRQELRGRYEVRNIIGSSHPMQELYGQVERVAPTSTTVLIRGESGTGKELVAHAIHYGSPRATQPFIKVSCGALPEGLIESELFGYERGAFTDAHARKQGRFELANKGTLFLDEVGELSGPTQVKLLRVLQEREFERLGGIKPIKVDVRLITATNKDLEAAVAAGTFREDLYYRLNVFSLYLPALRERRPDIPLLADHFVEKYAAAHGKDVRRIATSAIDTLVSYHWPGNVRELENAIERAVLVCEAGVIHAHHLPPTLQTADVSDTLPRLSLAGAVAAYEKDLLVDAFKSVRGNRAKAARLLDSTERIIGYKLRKYGIEPGRFKD